MILDKFRLDGKTAVLTGISWQRPLEKGDESAVSIRQIKWRRR